MTHFNSRYNIPAYMEIQVEWPERRFSDQLWLNMYHDGHYHIRFSSADYISSRISHHPDFDSPDRYSASSSLSNMLARLTAQALN